MTLAVNMVRGPRTVGDLQWAAADITFDNSYATSGEALTAANFGFTTAEPYAGIIKLSADPVGGLQFRYDYTANKLLAYLGTTDSSGTFSYTPGGGDIKGATAITAAMGTADQASDAVNAGTWNAYTTFTTASGAAGVLTQTLQPAFARNAVVTVKNDSGGALNLFTGTMTVTVVGTFRGAAQTDAIACTLTAPQVAVANTKFRAWGGTKPFDTITTVTIDATSLAAIAVADGALKIGVGPGVLVGFPIAPDTGANGDILTFSVNGAARAVSGNTDFTNSTISTGTIADGDDVGLVYKIDAEAVSGTAYGTSFGLPEVPASTNLSTVTTRVLAWASK